MKTAWIEGYEMRKGEVILEAHPNMLRTQEVIKEAFSMLQGEHEEELRDYLERKVSSYLGVASGTVKVVPQSELEVCSIELRLCGKSLDMFYNDSLEDVLSRWDKLESQS